MGSLYLITNWISVKGFYLVWSKTCKATFNHNYSLISLLYRFQKYVILEISFQEKLKCPKLFVLLLNQGKLNLVCKCISICHWSSPQYTFPHWILDAMLNVELKVNLNHLEVKKSVFFGKDATMFNGYPLQNNVWSKKNNVGYNKLDKM